MNELYFCCDERRRAAVADAKSKLNGIAYLEVHDGPGVPDAERQRRLFVHCLKADGVAGLNKNNVVIEGGDRIRNVKVTAAKVDPADDHLLVVEVDQPGDFSTYVLRLVSSPSDPTPPDPFDVLLSAVDFSFKVECSNEFDCAPVRECPPEPEESPEVQYLAKDYATFRRLMLDRLSAIAPDWQERNPADLGVALVELLAYLGDRLSYQQDAIATEAYLGTARSRVSVRRHARLVDYFIDEGRNSRAWVQVLLAEKRAPAEGLVLKRVEAGTGVRTRFLTRFVDAPRVQDSDLPAVLRDFAPEVFEPLHDAYLCPSHNEIQFYTWSDAACCLPKGATRATLADDPANPVRLRKGDVLVFEERLGPRSGLEPDADRSHRQAVRLTYVRPEATVVIVDGVETRTPGGPLTDKLTGQGVVEIGWDKADGLAFPLCISAVTDDEHGGDLVKGISVALGNTVLADHGRTVTGESLGVVPDATRFMPAPVQQGLDAADACKPAPLVPVPPRYRPGLAQAPLTHAAVYDSGAPARYGLAPLDPATYPAITLHGDTDGEPSVWISERDLLNSKDDDERFVVEIESDGTARLRFGDDRNGKRPDSGTAFTADYRVGNGLKGNVGAEALHHFIAGGSAADALDSVRNPLPASGGREPESIEDVRQAAPEAFKTQRRAVTTKDYSDVAGRLDGVQQATARFRWTGSWRTIFITADRLGGDPMDAAFETAMRDFVEPYRMAGQDLEVDGPVPVALELALHVCVQPGHFRSDVKAALVQLLSKRTLPDGRRGVFHPDNFTFGSTLYLSTILAACQAVPGVESVDATVFRRRGAHGEAVPASGKLTFGWLEIPRLDNDPNFPERGLVTLALDGGK
jgi:hypothetical protein